MVFTRKGGIFMVFNVSFREGIFLGDLISPKPLGFWETSGKPRCYDTFRISPLRKTCHLFENGGGELTAKDSKCKTICCIKKIVLCIYNYIYNIYIFICIYYINYIYCNTNIFMYKICYTHKCLILRIYT